MEEKALYTATVKPWKAKPPKYVRLFLSEWDEWYIIIGKNGNPMLATDAEVALWLRLQAAEAKLAESSSMKAGMKNET